MEQASRFTYTYVGWVSTWPSVLKPILTMNSDILCQMLEVHTLLILSTVTWFNKPRFSKSPMREERRFSLFFRNVFFQAQLVLRLLCPTCVNNQKQLYVVGHICGGCAFYSNVEAAILGLQSSNKSCHTCPSANTELIIKLNMGRIRLWKDKQIFIKHRVYKT